MKSIPCSKNFCGGNFQDWLEVNLTEKCNANCSWCVEKKGWHPKHHASMEVILQVILDTGKKHIILLGGEPTLYPHLRELIQALHKKDRKVYITTNGSMLNYTFVKKLLANNPNLLFGPTPLTGVNVSIHHYCMKNNREITGISLDKRVLKTAIDFLIWNDVSVRFNCNLIKGQIDSYPKILEYIAFADKMGANKVRFAELKYDEEKFVDTLKIIPNAKEVGLTDDPFKYGCNHDYVIEGMPVNFRQMCGLQAPKFRPVPVDPVQYPKQVLYYDGKIYDGWLTKAPTVKTETEMQRDSIIKMLEGVKSGEVTVIEAASKLEKTIDKKVSDAEASSGCAY